MSESIMKIYTLGLLLLLFLGSEPILSLDFVPQVPHAYQVKSLRISDDGRFLLSSGGSDKIVKLWDTRSMSLMRNLKGHKEDVEDAIFLPGNRRGISVNENGRLFLWDLETGEILKRSEETTGRSPSFLILSEDGKSLYINADDGKLRIIDAETLKPMGEYRVHEKTEKWTAKVSAALLMNDKGLLATGGLDGKVKSLNLRTGKTKLLYSADEGFTVESLALSPSGRTLGIITSNTGTVGILRGESRLSLLKSSTLSSWKLQWEKTLPTLAGGQGAQFTYNGDSLVIDGSPVIILDPETGEVKKRFVDRNNVIMSNHLVRMHPNLDAFYSIAHNQIELREVPGGGIIASTHTFNGNWPLSFSRDGKRLLYSRDTAGLPLGLIIFNRDQAGIKEIPLVRKKDWFLGSAIFTPDNKGISLFYNCYEEEREFDTHQFLDLLGDPKIEGFTHPGQSIGPGLNADTGDTEYAFSPDGKVLIKSGFESGKVVVHFMEDPEKGYEFSMHKNRYVSFAVSPDSRRVVSLDQDGGIYYWELDTGKTLPLPSAVEETGSNVSFGKRAFGFMPGEGYHLFIQNHGIEVYDLDAASGEMEEQPAYYPTPEPADEIVAAPDGSAFLTAWKENIHFIPLNDPENPKTFRGHTGSIQGLSFTPDGKQFWSSSYDDTARFWDIETGEYVTLIVTLSDWLLYTEDGYWDGSRNCGDLVAMVDGMDVFRIDQFAARNNRPDIILKRFNKDPSETTTELISHFRNRYQRRLRRMGIDEKDLDFDTSAVPKAEITSAVQDGRRLSLSFTLSKSLTPLKSYNLYVNDVPVYGAQGKRIKEKTKDTKVGRETKTVIEETVLLLPGENKIEVSCLNQAGLESFRPAVYVRYETPEERGDLYFIGFGVSEYMDETLNLRYAHKDAEDLEKIFRETSDKYDSVVSVTYKNEKMLRTSIVEVKELLMDTRVDDTVVLFISGHGVHDRDEAATYYFLSHETDLDNLSETAVPFRDLEGLLQEIPARRKLFLMDTCGSGEWDPEMLQKVFQITGDKGVQARVPRRADPSVESSSIPETQSSESAAGETLNPFKDASETARTYLSHRDRFIYNDLVRRSGAIVFSSCRGDQVSYENSKYQNGLFTEYLLRALRGEGDTNGDGAVSTEELRDYVRRKVAEETESNPLLYAHPQHPTVDRDNIYMKFGF